MPPKKITVGMEDTEINGVTTEQGRRFFSQLVNLLHGSTFGLTYSGEDSEFNDLVAHAQNRLGSMFPGLDFDLSPRRSQYINYLDIESRHRAWGETSQVDFDLDGLADTGYGLDDGIPFGLYLNNTNTFSNKDGRDAVNFSDFWNRIRTELPNDRSYGEIIGSGDYRDLGTESAFNLVLGLLQLKRGYVFGLNMLGMDAGDPNQEGTLDRINNAFTGWGVAEGGKYNSQVFWHYLNLRPDVVKRFEEIMGADGTSGAGRDFYNYIKSTLLPDYKSIFRARLRSIDIDQDQGGINGLAAQLAELRGYLDPATNRILLDDEDPGRVDRVRGLVTSIRASLAQISNGQQNINREIGIVPGRLSLKVGDYAARVGGFYLPAVIDETTDFSGNLTGLDEMLALARIINNLQTNAVDHSDSVLDNLFREYSMESGYRTSGITHPSSATVADDIRQEMLDEFEELNRPYLNHFVGTLANNSVFIQQNKRVDAKTREKKDLEVQEKQEMSKLEGEHYAKRKGERKAAEAKAANKPKPKAAPSKKRKVS
ncbi:hypothetical protein HZC35_04420 [Candidatus Saganbacteria bacterium]|nr:hypothetical protein [Candidatus Saganbacteria bacterium]